MGQPHNILKKKTFYTAWQWKKTQTFLDFCDSEVDACFLLRVDTQNRSVQFSNQSSMVVKNKRKLFPNKVNKVCQKVLLSLSVICFKGWSWIRQNTQGCSVQFTCGEEMADLLQ